MNLLLHNIENIVKDRIKINFNTDFRTAIAFEIMMQNPKYSLQAKTYEALKLFYPKFEEIKDIRKAIDNIIWFYTCGKEIQEQKENKKETIRIKQKQIYSYEFDDELIYSAFKDQYNLDLQDIEYLHWWKFKALFNGLKEDNKIVEIMGYRAMNISKIKDKEMKKHYKKLQEIYKLPDMRSEEEKEESFAEALW